MIKKNKIKVIMLLTMFFILVGLNTSKAGWISDDINGINEKRYPGYKASIQELQKKYPNWNIKLYYTGINWEDAINGEYVGHGSSPSSLSHYTYKGEWICPICGEKTYDVSHEWYCASKKAIAYMMDPRNSLTEDYVFQFQNLGSSAGTRSEVEKMVQGTFLQKTSCVDAIMEAAQTYNISPFHLVSRMTHEQGTSGMGTMNGYIYMTEQGIPVKVYNLYNINVSGNNPEEGFLAGAKFAYENGWFSQEASIIGGAKFLRTKYIDKGQNTLYFQKYNVVDTNNLYQHQYMQNIRAANDEGNVVYNAYKKSGIVSSHFEFVIPVYENMPVNPSPRPSNQNTTYVGDITTDIQQINLNKNGEERSYVNGQILVSEWIDGTTWSIPKIQPKIRIKATDNSETYEMTVSIIENNKYYFEGYIEGIDVKKDYIIEVESGNVNNVSKYRKVSGYCNFNKNIGQYRRDILKIENSILKFTPTNYYGDIAMDMLETKLNKNDNGYYLSGRVLVSEWIGKLWTEPDVNPKIEIVSTDNSYRQAFWTLKENGNQYYFDGYIDNLNPQKEYFIYITLANNYNLSTNKEARAIYKNDSDLGKIRRI